MTCAIRPEHTFGITATQERVITHSRPDQQAALKPCYDYIICGAGSAGCVLAGRLSADSAIDVLVLEAGGTDDVAEVFDPEKWALNLGTDRSWNYTTTPNAALEGRVLPYYMGKVLGGGSSINVGIWARGHKADWNGIAELVSDNRWSYDAILDSYRSIEDVRGDYDLSLRGVGGPMHIENSGANLHPFFEATLQAAESTGLQRFGQPNGAMMEGDGGCAPSDRILHHGVRQSTFRSFLEPFLDRPNLTVVTGAAVTKLKFKGSNASGVAGNIHGQQHEIAARCEIILTLGAVETPKLLMQSGVGDAEELGRFAIPVVQHLPGVGQNLQDHPSASCMWEFSREPDFQSNQAEAVAFWKSVAHLTSPDLLMFPLMIPYTSAELMGRLKPNPQSWSLACVLVHPYNRGRVRLTGANANDPLMIESNLLSDERDLRALKLGLQRCREIGRTDAMSYYRGCEILPNADDDATQTELIRAGTGNFYHQTGTAKMGSGLHSVAGSDLRVHGLHGLRIADGSVLPLTITGNTMAACVVIADRAASMRLKTKEESC